MTDKIREELTKGHKLLGLDKCAGELLIEPLGNTDYMGFAMACPRRIFHGSTEFPMYSTYRNADHQYFIVRRCGIPCR